MRNSLNNINCPHCFSNNISKYGKDIRLNQKYLCKDCHSQFTLNPKSKIKRKPKYFSCPICNHAVFLWHHYPTYNHFKCSHCNYSCKIDIPQPVFVSDDFNDFFIKPFKGFRHPPKFILLALSLYFDGYCSTRSIKRFFKSSFNISISHVSIFHWVKHFASFFKLIFKKIISKLNLYSDEWHADETVVKINGIKYYLWVLLDSETRVVISFHLSPYRDSQQAYALFSKACSLTNCLPKTIITDRLDSYNQAIASLYPHATHYPYNGFKDSLNNNFIESFNKTFKAWYKVKKGFKNFNSALDLITTFIFYYNCIHQHSSLNNLQPAIVAGATFSDSKISNWFLF